MFRMGATILLVVDALLLAALAESWQVEAARRMLADVVARLAGQYPVLRVPTRFARRRRWADGYVVVGPGGVMLIAALSVSQAAWGAIARRQLQHAAMTLREAARQLKSDPGDGAPPTGASSPAGVSSPAGQPATPSSATLPTFGIVVLLRRRLQPSELQWLRLAGVGGANPEHLPRLLEPLANPAAAAGGMPAATLVSPEAQAAAARRIRARWGALWVRPPGASHRGEVGMGTCPTT